MRIRMSIRGEKALRGLSLFFLRRVIRETLSQAFPRVFHSSRTIILDVACVSETEITKLNRTYRNVAVSTDTLSFGSWADLTAIRHLPAAGSVDLGQIILATDFIARSAQADGVSWKREFTYVFSHSILHLVGFDHEARMFEIQDAVTDQLASHPTH